MSGFASDLEHLLAQVADLKQVVEVYVRPFVCIDLFPRGSVNMLYLRIRNVGHSPALDVKASFNPTFPIRGRDVSEYDVFRSIPVLGPGDSIMFFFGSGVDLLAEGSPSKSLRGVLNYVDVAGRNFSEEIRFDLDIYRNLALVPEAQHDRTLESEMERLRREVEAISRYFTDLRLRQTAFPDVPDDTEVADQ